MENFKKFKICLGIFKKKRNFEIICLISFKIILFHPFVIKTKCRKDPFGLRMYKSIM